MISAGNSLADIGTDHGYIPIYMALNGLTAKAFAMDINEGPLERASKNINRYKVEGIVETRLSNGLSSLLSGEAESLVIAGMGGLLINRILADGIECANSAKELILSPHSDTDKVRLFLADNGFCIIDEQIVYDEGKYYFILKAVNGSMKLEDDSEIRYGRFLDSKGNDVFRNYLLLEYNKRQQIADKIKNSKSESNIERLKQLDEEMKLIKSRL